MARKSIKACHFFCKKSNQKNSVVFFASGHDRKDALRFPIGFNCDVVLRVMVSDPQIVRWSARVRTRPTNYFATIDHG